MSLQHWEYCLSSTYITKRPHVSIVMHLLRQISHVLPLVVFLCLAWLSQVIWLSVKHWHCLDIHHSYVIHSDDPKGILSRIDATPCRHRACTYVSHAPPVYLHHFKTRARQHNKSLYKQHDVRIRPINDMETAVANKCSVCFEDMEHGMKIYGDLVCEGCVHAGIIPKFISALHHEVDYPPKWGPHRLHPWDFKDFLVDPEDFMNEWKDKLLEYETPVHIRLYCGNCQVFVCERDERRLIRLMCIKCDSLICSGCGGVYENDDSHGCKDVADAFEGLVRGKHWQVCPNTECKMRVQLREGCNALVCASSSCNTEFCFVCGEQTSHDFNHWKLGSKCPRWNQPGAQNAHFDDPEPNPQARQDGIDFWIGRNEGRPLDVPEMMRLIARIDVLDVRDMGAALGLMGRVTAFVATAHPAGFQHQTNMERLAAEANMAADIHPTPLAFLMRHQQNQLIALGQVAETMIRDHEAANPRRPVPAFLPAAIDLFVKLRMQLDIYVFPARLQAGLNGFLRRQDEIDALTERRHLGQIIDHFPMAVRVWTTYVAIADQRLTMAMDVERIFDRPRREQA